MTVKATRAWASRLAAATVFIMLALLPATMASAHSEVMETTPADGAELSKAPTQVQLVFDEAIQQQGGSIVVTVGDNTVSDANTFATDGNVATVQLMESPGPGSYTVKYRIVSADGHIASDTFGYSVTGTSSSSSSGASTQPAGDTGSTENSSGTVIWVLGLGAIGIVLVAAVISVAVRGRRDHSD